MGTSDNASGSKAGWFGFGRSRAGDVPAATPAPSGSVFQQARRQLLDEISEFLLRHDLEVSPANLLIAHGAFSGSNPGLARQIASRIKSGKAVTQEWLDETTANDDKKGDHEGIQLLIARLESTLEGFSKSTRAARTATASYGDELEQQVADLGQVGDTGQIINRLADLATVMLDRTRKVEAEMRNSEDEAKSLRAKLAKAKRDAEVDHLTGLPNRRAFEELLDRHYREAQASIEPLSVAFCDIDHFKRVNDTHGHDTGDRVIRMIAEALAVIANDNCHVARHGGEEFVMLFRGLATQEAKQRLDKVREQMGAKSLVNRKTDEPIGAITFSGGVADVFAFPDAREALKAADEALYEAKEAGRNRIVVAKR